MDKARALNGGEQPYIQTPDGYRIPLTMYQGLMYIDVRPVRDDEWASTLLAVFPQASMEQM